MYNQRNSRNKYSYFSTLPEFQKGIKKENDYEHTSRKTDPRTDDG